MDDDERESRIAELEEELRLLRDDEPAYDPTAAYAESVAAVKGDVGTLPGVPIIGSADVVNSGRARVDG